MERNVIQQRKQSYKFTVNQITEYNQNYNGVQYLYQEWWLFSEILSTLFSLLNGCKRLFYKWTQRKTYFTRF